MDSPYFNLSQFPSVYEPREDTFLLMDALEAELDFIKDELKPTMVAEIGSGCGITITSFKQALASDVFCMATDLNREACAATQHTAHINGGIQLDVFNMSFLDAFRKNIFDVVFFNPPYVETDSSEIRGYGIERSWAGGIDGREVIDQFMPKIYDMLTDRGVLYLVCVRENKPKDIMEVMHRFKFRPEFIKQRQVRGEHLFILKFRKL